MLLVFIALCFIIPLVVMLILRSNALAKDPKRAAFLATKKYLDMHAPTKLVSIKKFIESRIEEIDQRQRKIAGILGNISSNTSAQWQSVQEALKTASRSLQHQRNRYLFKHKEVAVLIWQSRLCYLAEGLDNLNFIEAGSHLKVIEIAQKGGEKLLLSLRVEDASNSDVRNLISSVEESLAALKKLREALLARQATLTLKEVTPLKTASQSLPALTEAYREPFTFNARVSITDFSSSIEEIEAEYMRIQVEEEMVPLLGNVDNAQ